jgi:hypothetical protein
VQVATSGADEHIAILDVRTGQEVMVLDDALDGKGNTIKFSFDGTRIQIGKQLDVDSLLLFTHESECQTLTTSKPFSNLAGVLL